MAPVGHISEAGHMKSKRPAVRDIRPARLAPVENGPAERGIHPYAPWTSSTFVILRDEVSFDVGGKTVERVVNCSFVYIGRRFGHRGM